MNNTKRDIDIDFSIAASEFINEENIPNLAYLCLYGSQNYALDTFQSDIDIKGFVYPTVEDIAYSKSKASNTGLYFIPEGTVSLQDIRVFMRELKKSNINALEFLFTSYFMFTDKIFSPADAAIRELKSYRNDIVTCNPDGLYNSAYGVASNAYLRLTNPEFEHWEKATAKILRIANFCTSYKSNENFEESLKSFPVYSRDMIMSIKAKGIPCELCDGIATEAMQKIKEIEKFDIEPNYFYIETIDDILKTMVKNLFKG